MRTSSPIFGLFAFCTLLLSSCKNAQSLTGKNGVVKVLGYSDDDAPVDAVSVTAIGGGAPAVILAQQLDVQTESEVSKPNQKNIEPESNEPITFDSLFLFERNSYQITPAMEQNLLRIVRIAKKYENTTILIEGYTDATEKPTKLNLSEKRAKAIADYLMNRKIKSSRIQARGYGDTQPIFSSKLAQGRVKNRKVEVSIIAKANDEHSTLKK